MGIQRLAQPLVARRVERVVHAVDLRAADVDRDAVEVGESEVGLLLADGVALLAQPGFDAQRETLRRRDVVEDDRCALGPEFSLKYR